jgi:hypothetical protein
MTDVPEGFTRETWVYTGVRRTASGQARQSWRDEAGRSYIYPGRYGHLVTGGYYTVDVNRADESLTRYAPVYTGRRVDAEERAALEAQEFGVKAQIAREARERKDRKDSALNDALRPLLAVAAKLNGTADREALARYVAARIHQA